jgi:hypothetical protein
VQPYAEITKVFVPEEGMVLSSDVRDVYFQGGAIHGC